MTLQQEPKRGWKSSFSALKHPLQRRIAKKGEGEQKAHREKKMDIGNELRGAAFLMATSAVGPGFLTQTALFTSHFGADFVSAILFSALLDIVIQLNVWRVMAVSAKRAPDLADSVIHGAGAVLSAMVILGGMAFNIGNIAGTGLGLESAVGLRTEFGAALSALLACSIFMMPRALTAMDKCVQMLGVLMIGLTLYVAFISAPPLEEVASRLVLPHNMDSQTYLQRFVPAILTLVGGTVGGYITFAGGHRLLEAFPKATAIHGASPPDSSSNTSSDISVNTSPKTFPDSTPAITLDAMRAMMRRVNASAGLGILLATLMRVALFLAALGVFSSGGAPDEHNPASSIFTLSLGALGTRLFGVVLWSAALTSVIGSAYTSVSFLRIATPERRSRLVPVFIAVSALIFFTVGKPVQILVFAGTLNSFILPLALGIVLFAAHKRKIVGSYHHPRWLTLTGIAALCALAGMSLITLLG